MDLLEFFIPANATLRKWGVYLIVAEDIESKAKYVYIGKIGDNRKGCNPIISRIGNHFSFNKKHSQFRNNELITADKCNYRIFYKLFDDYTEHNENIRIENKDKTNERERLLNRIVQEIKEKQNLDFTIINLLSKTVKNKYLNVLNHSEISEIDKFAQEVISRI
jgi:hypothetical protein